MLTKFVLGLTIAVLAVISLLILTACSSTLTPLPTPEVKIPVITTPQPLRPHQEVLIVVPVNGVPGVEFTCEWESLHGSILSGQGTCDIFYQAPEHPGQYVVKVDIVGKNFAIQRSAYIEVLAITETPTSPEKTSPAIAGKSTLTSTPTPPIFAPTLPIFECTDIEEIPEPECEALAALYNSTDGTNWSNSTGWLETNTPCSSPWYGVTCDVNNHVASLQLQDNNLTGLIPPELGDLSQLTELWLQRNQLTGSIPPEIGGLGNLKQLYLSENKLSGPISPELAKLAQVTDLYLGDNPLGGTIPPALGALSNLVELRLENADLQGAIPTELGNLSRLKVLYLNGNQLSGVIPKELGQLVQLTRLLLSNNQLTGPIPLELGNLTNLQRLYLGTNQLTGEIPLSFTSLTELTEFDVSGNDLMIADPALLAFFNAKAFDLAATLSVFGTCTNVTEIPTVECEALVVLYNSTDGPHWSNNDNWLETTTPCSTPWYGVTCEDGHVTRLILSENQLAGLIPAELGRLSNLTILLLNHNQLTGEIPAELGNLTNLSNLSLQNNQLSGVVPATFRQLVNLQVLALHQNNLLSGPIPPELGELTLLTELQLSNNQFSGTIPPELGNLSNLKRLGIAGTNVEGAIPPELGNLTSLEWLILHINQLSGEIPPELGSLTNLTILSLGQNQLTGEIPEQLSSLTKLEDLNLNENNLTGTIPSALGNLQNLKGLSLAKNKLTGEIPAELGQLSNLAELYLPENQLSGPIPAALSNLKHLTHLLLYDNQLTGAIPPEISTLPQLVLLSLYENQLSGAVPPELCNLPNLKRLVIHSNRLSERLPPCMVNLDLEEFTFDNTDICESADLQAWLADIPPSNLRRTNVTCEPVVAHWSCDNNVAVDRTGHGHDGTLIGGAACEDVDGVSAFRLDGVNGYVEIPASNDFLMTSFTLSLWFKIPQASAIDQIESTITYALLQSTTGEIPGLAGYHIQIAIQKDQPSEPTLKGSYSLQAQRREADYAESLQKERWYHVVLMRDAEAQEGIFCVDGALTGGRTIQAPSIQSKSPLRFGQFNYESLKTHFDGHIANVRLYNRALSREELADIRYEDFPRESADIEIVRESSICNG